MCVVHDDLDARSDECTSYRGARNVGSVAINGWSPLDARLPWGGFKNSGSGHDLSKTSLLAFLRKKVVTTVL
ncbi:MULTISPECIES: aldehyde dehydrogenase family protein [unclassified Burkholderia]|uniref:aldehyde dehydrogenase family protein n=1 Tax=Burkholderia sp. BCC1208 TaxID=2676292 RepID=UPI002AAF40EB|nr:MULTISPECIES: aldehyde dehydrogenase family protein [unclassified Burkholderia]